jgi:arylsulfatase A-like enzyme
MYGIRHGAVGHGGTAADRTLTGAERSFTDRVDRNNLFFQFRNAGMKTASVSTFGERHSSYWFNAGFNEIYNVGKGGGESGEEVLPYALDWLDRNGKDDNWFLHVHFWDPHTPYRAPEPFASAFDGAPLDTWITESIFAGHQKHVGPHCANEINMYDDSISPAYPRHPGRLDNLSDVAKLINGYDAGVLFADHLVGQIAGRLKALGVYDGDLAIIITSDHGENIGELGIYSEHATADYATCRIPLIIKWPGRPAGITDDGLRSNVDLLPTLAALLGRPACPDWDGVSFADAIMQGSGCRGRDDLVISQMAHVCQRSARFGDWLYMRTYHDGYHLFDNEMLYNVKDDPYERRDIKHEHPAICEKGAKIILDWHDAMLKKSNGGADPLWTILREGGPFHARGHLDAYLARLRATGRAEGAALLEAKYK